MTIVDHAPGWWFLFGLVCAVLLLVTEAGFRGGVASARSESRGAISGQAGAALAALLGLLGLLLAFSFSIVESRFAARKQLVLEEANAIGTAHLRASLLPPPHDARVRELLERYVALRTPRTRDEVATAIARSEALHDALWTEATAAAWRDPRSELAPLFVEALNEVIDLHEERVTIVLHQRLPLPILATLIGVALLAMCVLGYGAGLSGVRALVPTIALTLTLSAVMVVIVELDRPDGIFRVSQSALEHTRDAMTRAARPE